MDETELQVFRSSRVLINGSFKPASIVCKGGEIVYIGDDAGFLTEQAKRVHDFGDLFLGPGLVDIGGEFSKSAWKGGITTKGD